MIMRQEAFIAWLHCRQWSLLGVWQHVYIDKNRNAETAHLAWAPFHVSAGGREVIFNHWYITLGFQTETQDLLKLHDWFSKVPSSGTLSAWFSSWWSWPSAKLPHTLTTQDTHSMQSTGHIFGAALSPWQNRYNRQIEYPLWRLLGMGRCLYFRIIAYI